MGCANSKKDYQASKKVDSAKQVLPAPPSASEPAPVDSNNPTPATDSVKPVISSTPAPASEPETFRGNTLAEHKPADKNAYKPTGPPAPEELKAPAAPQAPFAPKAP